MLIDAELHAFSSKAVKSSWLKSVLGMVYRFEGFLRTMALWRMGWQWAAMVSLIPLVIARLV